MAEKKSSMDDIVGTGLSDEDKQFLLGVVGEVLDSGGEPDEMEKEKTSDQIQICRLMNEATNQLRENFGLEPSDVPVANIHAINNELVIWNDQKIGGTFNAEKQNIFVKEGRCNIEFADYVCHELIHMKSHGKAQLPEGDDPELDWFYRSGFGMKSRDGKKNYFWHLDEGLTEELAKRIVNALRQDPLFAQDEAETARIREEKKDKPSIVEMFDHGEVLFAEQLPDDHPSRQEGYTVELTPFAYGPQREILGQLIAKIYQRNTDKFRDGNEVFLAFARGKLQGNVMGIARVIENTFSKGTFRKLGEASNSSLDEYRKFVDSL